jgi:hypothetical protein
MCACDTSSKLCRSVLPMNNKKVPIADNKSNQMHHTMAFWPNGPRQQSSHAVTVPAMHHVHLVVTRIIHLASALWQDNYAPLVPVGNNAEIGCILSMRPHRSEGDLLTTFSSLPTNHPSPPLNQSPLQLIGPLTTILSSHHIFALPDVEIGHLATPTLLNPAEEPNSTPTPAPPI